ncbi:Uncharacterised protein [Plesiomonas shigelloides]|uniref:DUF5677 domain-containing protein n=1 Tax=Plesiomonas shigelloides TaxID=703 RepID=UPI0007ECF38F|nr:DUF5677 domain-containing protein [Plesiomonas shigelloides]SBT60894.1 Uncharacterised protein [Plesiomonas shigelloides]
MNSENNLDTLNKIFEMSVELYDAIKGDGNENYAYTTMVGVFASMIEQTKAFTKLYECGLYASTQSIARCIIECYVDAKNIDLEPNYVNYLWAELFARQKEMAKSRGEKRKYKLRRDDCFKIYSGEDTYTEMSINKKFTLAGRKSIYEVVYSKLSSHTHSGISLLMNRVEVQCDGNIILNKLNNDLFKNTPSVLEKGVIEVLEVLLLEVCEIIGARCGRGAESKIKAFACVYHGKAS